MVVFTYICMGIALIGAIAGLVMAIVDKDDRMESMLSKICWGITCACILVLLVLTFLFMYNAHIICAN